MANSVDPNQTGAVCSGSTLFASILNSSVMLGNYLQQTKFSDAFFLGALRVKYTYIIPLSCYFQTRLICYHNYFYTFDPNHY